MAQAVPDPRLEDLVPANNIEAEMAVLGSMMLSERASEQVVNFVTEDDFYVPAHREIFRALTQLLTSHKVIDLVTLKNELLEREKLDQVGGKEYLIKIVESVPSAANSEYYAGIVQDKATLRRLEDAANQILKDVHRPDGTADEMVNEAESLVFEVGRKRLGRYFEGVATLATQFFEDVDHLMDTGEPILGTPTGYSDLDEVTTGFYGGDFVVIAARPAMGKTSLALNFALHVAGQGKGNVAIFSLEMSGQQLVRRLISMLAKVPMNTLKKANLSNENYQKLVDACEALHSMPIFIDDSSDISPLEMRGKCRRLKADGGLSLVIVDYLQLMRGSRRSENRTQEIGEIARGLKALSKELDVPVIALSQLNRAVESRENKRPMLADIRESGSIEAEADMVMFIYRHKYYQRQEVSSFQDATAGENEATELIIGKHRNGPTGTVLLGFQPSYTRFTQLDEDSKAQYWKMLRDRSE
ncbi:MAG: replicative DNA helicase [Armatimonadetes bacterium]|nr:replicative DNA helicase [Armatimonadota bacterium]